MKSILVFFHCRANTGYAISRYEQSFFRMAARLTGDAGAVHFAYTAVSDSDAQGLPHGLQNVIQFDPATSDSAAIDRLAAYVQANEIDFAFGVDQPVWRPSYRALRDGGVRNFVSYWGAPISDETRGVRLLLKRLQVRAYRRRPDHFIFESRAMARTATHGRGIPSSDVSVVYLGIDPDRFTPDQGDPNFLANHFGIPLDRKTVVFTGHFEERKGVAVLVRAFRELIENRNRTDCHLLLLGNKSGEEEPYRHLVRDTITEGHVTFGGYREDVPAILPNCVAGAIASTGWDSFTVSALEMAASGLPLVVSDLQGLSETVDPGVTGFTCPPGDHTAFADRFELLFDEPERRNTMSVAARQRVLEHFTDEHQINQLVDVCLEVQREH